MSPAAWVIQAFGGVGKTARALGRHASTVSKWVMPRDQRGLEGNVPRKVQRLILERARERGLDIRPEDLIYGRDTGRSDAGVMAGCSEETENARPG